jgi:hypothetical protein
MQTQAPKGQHLVIGLDPVDTLASPSGPLWKDSETFDEARDLADRNEPLYISCCVYDDAGELSYEAAVTRTSFEGLKIERLNQEPPGAQNETVAGC